jgi:hypothetical protein
MGTCSGFDSFEAFSMEAAAGHLYEISWDEKAKY